MRRLRVPLALLCLAVPVAACSDTAAERPGTTPGAGVAGDAEPGSERPSAWPTVDARKAGLRPAALSRLARQARGMRSTCYLVAREGRLVAEWDWRATSPDQPREVFSITKSVLSALVGIAEDDGLLRLDDRAARWIPAWRGSASAEVTVRDLLTNTSGRRWSAESDYQRLVGAQDRTRYAIGLDQQHPPGETWAYNNAAIQTLDRVLSEATGGTTADYAREHLFDPLGMDDSRLTTDASGRSTNVFFGMQTTCRDLARFGQLYLDGGRAGDDRILPHRYVDASVGEPGSPHNAAYGFLWWLNRPGTLRSPLDEVDAAGRPVDPRTGQLAPGAPSDAYAAQGLGGQTLLVDPGSGTLVVRLGLLPRGTDAYGIGDAARVLTDALAR